MTAPTFEKAEESQASMLPTRPDHSGRKVVNLVKKVAPRLAGWISKKRFRTCRPPVGWIRFGSLGRLQPVSAVWGHDRGSPINRHYIESFLSNHADDIHGRVLEVADNKYTVRFGGERVIKSDILHNSLDNSNATIVSDLAKAENIPDNLFDCIILTQVMQYIYDSRAAVRTLHRILKPGGVMLATLPGLEKVSVVDDARWGDYWRFTEKSGNVLFTEAFGAGNVKTHSYGNVFSAIASLMGLSQEDVQLHDLNAASADFPVIVAVRAVKSVT